MNPIIDNLSSEQKKALWSLFDNLRESFKKPICFNSSSDCNRVIVNSHTIQRKALAVIAHNGHVYEMRPDTSDILKKGESFGPNRRGIFECSTFKGFCATHDLDVFKPIETRDYTATSEQHFLYFYRAFCKEFYEKIQVVKSKLKLEEAQEINPNFTQENYRSYEVFWLQSIASTLKLFEIKARLDAIFKAGEYSRIQSFVILFEKTPSVLCASFFNALYDFAGKPCQNMFDGRKPYPGITLTVIPTTTGGVAIFSWLDISSKEPEQFCRTIEHIASKDMTDALIQMIFEYCGNIAINPVWWDSLDKLSQEELMGRFRSGMFTNAPRSADCLKIRSSNIDNWLPSKSFYR